MTGSSIASGLAVIGVAVSGGADSVLLLYALHQLAEKVGIQIVVVHVNHGLRGEESAGDEAFVRSLAAELRLPIHVFSRPIPNQTGNLEQQARDLRREVFTGLMRDGLASRIALGHTLSDQAETLLFRLIRGTGLSGLAGMRLVSEDGLIRPLLSFTRQQVRTWAAEAGLRWREDSSNLDQRFRRNAIRSEVMPLLRDRFNPAVEQVLARTAEFAQAEEEYWAALVQAKFDRFVRRSRYGLLCNLDLLRGEHLAVQRRLLRRAFLEVRGNLRELDSAHVDAVVSICRSAEGHDRVLVPGIDAMRSFDTLRLTPPSAPGETGKRHYRVPVTLDAEICLPFGAGSLCFEKVTERVRNGSNCAKFINVKNHSEAAILNWQALGGEGGLNRLVLRNWEPGDAYRPAGAQNTKKLKELFQAGRVLLWERRHWPVLELDGEIVWTRRFGADMKFRAEPASGSAVSLIYRAGE